MFLLLRNEETETSIEIVPSSFHLLAEFSVQFLYPQGRSLISRKLDQFQKMPVRVLESSTPSQVSGILLFFPFLIVLMKLQKCRSLKCAL